MTTRKSFTEIDKSGYNKESGERTSFTKKAFIIALFCVLFAVLYTLVTSKPYSGKIEPITVRNVFIDVDGDGALDFVTYIEYVPNSTSSIVFPDGQ